MGRFNCRFIVAGSQKAYETFGNAAEEHALKVVLLNGQTKRV